VIQLTGLSKTFGDFYAVRDLNLDIGEGCIFAFLGTNGAGKTTTIRMMTGVLQPTEGKVEIGGFDMSRDPLKAKLLMGVIPDRPYLYGKLTGREFVLFMADLYDVHEKTAVKRADELLDLYQMSKWQHELIEGYSHGMRQRLMLAAAQVHDPRILVVDEPMVGLDPPGAKLLKDTLRKRAARGKTVFLSTHSLGVAEELADELAIIKHGVLRSRGTLSELHSQSTTGQAANLEELFLEIVEAEMNEGDLPGEESQ
jgi:ABC-2 type transport system ATP-binding protein